MNRIVRVASVVPARGGSKGLPGKNIRPLCGKPLLAYSVEAAQECKEIDSVWGNSDDPRALEIGRDLGAQIYERPAEHANDTATMQSVIADFARHLKTLAEPPDAVMVLYPTHPLRTAADVRGIYHRFCAEGADRPIIGIKESKTHPYLFYTIDEHCRPKTFSGIDPNRFYRRQDYPKAYELTTFACVLPLDEIFTLNAQLQNDRTLAIFVDADKTVDIDTLADFELAEAVLERRQAKTERGRAAE
jgi:CMP-N-acetylneuraminic acid synthetase